MQSWFASKKIFRLKKKLRFLKVLFRNICDQPDDTGGLESNGNASTCRHVAAGTWLACRYGWLQVPRYLCSVSWKQTNPSKLGLSRSKLLHRLHPINRNYPRKDSHVNKILWQLSALLHSGEIISHGVSLSHCNLTCANQRYLRDSDQLIPLYYAGLCICDKQLAKDRGRGGGATKHHLCECLLSYPNCVVGSMGTLTYWAFDSMLHYGEFLPAPVCPIEKTTLLPDI